MFRIFNVFSLLEGKRKHRALNMQMDMFACVSIKVFSNLSLEAKIRKVSHLLCSRVNRTHASRSPLDQ